MSGHEFAQKLKGSNGRRHRTMKAYCKLLLGMSWCNSPQRHTLTTRRFPKHTHRAHSRRHAYIHTHAHIHTRFPHTVTPIVTPVTPLALLEVSIDTSQSLEQPTPPSVNRLWRLPRRIRSSMTSGFRKAPLDGLAPRPAAHASRDRWYTAVAVWCTWWNAFQCIGFRCCSQSGSATVFLKSCSA